MPVLTANQKVTQFDHLMNDLIQRDADNSPLAKALIHHFGTASVYKDIDNLLALTASDISSLEYFEEVPDPNDPNQTISTKRPLPRGDQGILHAVIGFFVWMKNKGEEIQADAWTSISFDKFRDYRVNHHWRTTAQRAIATSPSTTTSGGATLRAPTKTPEQLFRAGVKKDPGAYPVLKVDHDYDDWRRMTHALAKTHDVEDIFNPNYSPGDPDDTKLFEAKQAYIYTVLVRVLQTDKGKSLVRDHENDSNAQKILKELAEYHEKSTKSDLDGHDRLSYIMTCTFGQSDSSWKGTARAFVHHWLDQVRLYEKTVPTTAHFDETQKMILLEKAVSGVDSLNQVSITNKQLKASGGNPADYDGYIKLLLSAADTYDKKHQGKYGSTKSARRRNVYYQGQNMDTPQEYGTYDIDTPIGALLDSTGYEGSTSPIADMNDPDWQVFQSQQGYRPRQNPREGNGQPNFVLPKEAYQQLSTSARSLWRQIPRDMQELIVKACIPDKPRSANKLEQLISAYQAQHTPQEDSPPREAYPLIEYLAKQHDAISGTPSSQTDNQPDDAQADTEPPPSDATLHPASLAQLLSNTRSTFSTTIYTVSERNQYVRTITSLIDRGANGGVGGEDTRVIEWDASGRTVDIEGVDSHRVTSIRLASCGGVGMTNHGEVIFVFHQYAYLGKGHSIHSAGQIEAFGHDLCDKSYKVGGKQRLVISQGNLDYTVPFSVERGLVRMTLRPYTDAEWDTLPHIIVTSDKEWDPTILDHEWPNGTFPPSEAPTQKHFRIPFTPLGEYADRYSAAMINGQSQVPDRSPTDPIDRTIEDCVLASLDDKPRTTPSWTVNLTRLSRTAFTALVTITAFLVVAFRNQTVQKPDYAKLRPSFGWVSPDIIEKTFDRTTQYARIPGNTTILHRHYRSPFPAHNVPRRDEDVSTDTVFGPVPAVDNGATMAQIFVGRSTLLSDVYGMKTEKQFVDTLADNIRERGAMNRLLSDSAKVEISRKALELLRLLLVGAWQSEPDQQNQNPAERRYNTIKTRTNIIMDRTASEPEKWLLALEYVCDLLNHLYTEAIGAVPLQLATGSRPDISPFLRFHFNQPVYYRNVNPKLGVSPERRGRWVGVSRHVGHELCYKILDDETHKIHHSSSVRPITDGDLNLRLEPIGGERDPIIKSLRLPREPNSKGSKTNIRDSVYQYQGKTREQQEKSMENKLQDPDIGELNDQPTPIYLPLNGELAKGLQDGKFKPQDLIGRTFLKDVGHEKLRLRIAEAIEDHESSVEENPTRIKFKVKSTNEDYEDMITYAELLDHIEDQENEDPVLWKYKRIVAHQGPLRPEDEHYNGSSYNVKLEWEDGTMTYEPLNVISADDPVTCAIYAKENDLLDTPGWKRFKRLARRTKKFIRAINQAKLRSYHNAVKYKYGFEVPKNYKDAIRLDRINGNTRWQDATKLEMGQLDDYNTFQDVGKIKPKGYKQIKVHLVYDVKHDGRHKARMVADGHLTDIPLESVYSGVVSIRGVRIVAFLAELNDLELWQTDIGNAYLEAETSEKNCILAGPEFGEHRCNHFLIIRKALYGLRTSGKQWHIRFAACLKELGFKPSLAEPDIWMRKTKNKHGIDVYEYVAVYVDDLMMAMVKPEEFAKILKEKYKFKLKGTGEIGFHLGMDFKRDPDGTLAITTTKYLERMFAEYYQHFKERPKKTPHSPLAPGDHPELDESELLEDDKITLYQSMIGSLQWAVTIGRIDILTAVVSMSSFRAAPRKGHLDRLKRMYGYLAKFDTACIRIRTEEPDLSGLPTPAYQWSDSVYDESPEEIPKDAPEPLGKYVQFTHYVDANLMHNVLTGKSLTGVLHFANQTPIDYFSKKQATVETATFGSEIVAARTATEQIIDLRYTFRYLGVPIREKSFLFGDNKTVVDSTMTPHGKINKRHTMLSYHRVRQAIASGMLVFHHIPGSINPADILSKHWAYQAVWSNLLRPLLFWHGDPKGTMVDNLGTNEA